MGRRPGYHHSEATKRRIAQSLTKHPKKEKPVMPAAAATTPNPQEAATSDPLAALAAGPLSAIIAAMLWKNRHREPECAVQITERDLAGLRACCDYLGVEPDARIVRNKGKPYVVVALVERGTDNAIRPVENNEADHAAAQEAKAFRRAQDQAMAIAAELQRASATGEFSSSLIQEAAQCLVALAR